MPGLKTVAPSTPADAKGLLLAAIRDDDLVVVFEHKLLYGMSGRGAGGRRRRSRSERADIKREGDDVTIVGISRMVHHALEAAEQLAAEGIEAEVVDPRTLSPLDTDTILASVEKTHRLVIVDEDNPLCSVAATIAAIVADEGFDSLDAPIKCVTAPHTPVPFSPPLEQAYIPSPGSDRRRGAAIFCSSAVHADGRSRKAAEVGPDDGVGHRHGVAVRRG